MKRKIAIVAGGDTSEYKVSLRSAAGIASFLGKERYDVFIVLMHEGEWKVLLDEEGTKTALIDRNDFSFLLEGTRTRFDYAYITIHGTPGEDGRLQGYFDMLGIPYSNCGVLASALTYDKFACNQYLKAFGMRIADSLLLKKGQDYKVEELAETIGLPCFVKPSGGGSSFGVSKVKEIGQMQEAIDKAFTEADQVVVEAFLQGREFSCGCYVTPQTRRALPATEVISHNEFFDYDAKYNGQVEEITPAQIPAELMSRMQQLTLAIYDILSARGIIRVDYIVTEGDKINLLEVNTTPGMTATSFIPQQVKAAGLDMGEVLSEIIESSFKD